MVDIPRLIIAAPASGHGKTTVATGLLAALTARGVRATGAKIGPDYIDPSYHALACRRPGRNLDPVLVGADLIGPLFAHGAAGADIAIIEGVMGLFDGRASDGTGSTAQVAQLLDAPVVLVVDATGQGRSLAALLHGFRTFEPGARLVGVVLNRVGSDRHEQILRAACEEVALPVLGALRRSEPGAAEVVPSRHLGLIPAAEADHAARAAVAAMGELVARGVDMEALLAVARTAPPLASASESGAFPAPPWGSPPWSPVAAAALSQVTVAVAGGPAFTFGYAEQAELLRSAGAVVATFDPLRDEKLPSGTAAIVAGGGFPEEHAAELAANVPLRQAVRELAASGAPIVAECGGLLWLSRTLRDSAGAEHEMCGVLPASARMTDRLTLGYRDAVALSDSVLADRGTRVTGHEFHRTAVTPPAGAEPAWAWRDSAACEGFVHNGGHASYLHTHWAAHPQFAERLVRRAGQVTACG